MRLSLLRGRFAALTWFALCACDSEPTAAGPDRGGADTDRDRGDAATDAAAAPDAEGDTQTDGQGEDAATDAAGADTAGGLCTPGERYCVDTDTTAVCDAGGAAFAESDCPAGEFCAPASGTCVPGICAPDVRECVDENTYRRCAPDGQSYSETGSCAPGERCDGGGCEPIGCVPRVMFAFDHSSSMSSELSAIAAAIDNVVAANPDVAFGVSMFPTGAGCSIGDGTGLFTPGVDWPDVAIAPDTRATIASFMSGPADERFAGATPLISTIEWMTENVGLIWGEVPQNGYLIVMTEGADTCRCDSDDPSAATDCMVDEGGAATAALTATGVRTYVIGYRYSEEPESLNAIARAGGTDRTEFIAAGNEATLTDAFEALITDIKDCL